MDALAPSRTALGVCAFRAFEARRAPSDRIVDDPYAQLFLPAPLRVAVPAATAAMALVPHATPGLTTFIVARHRFIDDALATFLAAAGDDAQLLVLGAGYDTRAWRFAGALRGRLTVEVDLPGTARRKRAFIDKRADRFAAVNREVVEVDFVDTTLEAGLRGSRFVSRAPTFVVWEGVSMYLPRAAVVDTLSTVRALTAPGSALLADWWYPLDAPGLAAAAHRAAAHGLHLMGEPVLYGSHPDDTPALLASCGYALHDAADARTLRERYVRDERPVFRAMHVTHAVTT